MRFNQILAAGLWVGLISCGNVFGQDLTREQLDEGSKRLAAKGQMGKPLIEVAKQRLDVLGQIREMGKLEKMDVNRGYMAATAAFLIGMPQEGIKPMERAMKDDPEGKVPGLNVPFSVAGHFVIGALAKYSGDWDRAIGEYKAAIEATGAVEGREKIKPGLNAVAMLYLAEAQEKIGKREEAMKTLEAIEKLPEQKSNSGAMPVDSFKTWAKWNLEVLRTGKAQQSEKEILLSLDETSMLAMMLISLSGLDNAVELGRLERSEISLYEDFGLLVGASSVSGIDRDCITLSHGISMLQGKQQLEKAKPIFMEGMERGGFGGVQHALFALHCMKGLKQDEEAKALQAKLIECYPNLEKEILRIYPGQ